MDNIDDSVPAQCATEFTSTLQESNTSYSVQITAPYNNRMTLSNVALEVSKHYRRNFKLNFVFPLQCIDGAIVEILNADQSIPSSMRLLATVRLRYTPNELTYDKNTGTISLQTYLNDLSFENKILGATVTDPNNI
jgi:hypothetical protein